MLQPMNAVEKLSARVIERAAAQPVDAVLRKELKASHLARRDSAKVADLVFTYFRWRGWLDERAPLTQHFQAVRKLDERFRAGPDTFTTEELTQAVPSWVQDEVTVSREWLISLQTRPALWLRAKRGTGPELTRRLGHCQPASPESAPGVPPGIGLVKAASPSVFPALSDALEYTGDRDLFRTPEFHAGDFEVQDIASQFVGWLCEPKPGETWWDACAGEGGKTLHLSDLMQNQGLIWATDRSSPRLAKLKQRAARAGVFNYRTAFWDGSPRLPAKTRFHGVLIDAPCSGVGTWQRNPQARWTTTMDDVRELAVIQQQLVLNAAAAVKPGGKLIYAVCSLTRTETDAVADSCSRQLPGFAASLLRAWTNEPPAASARKWFWPQHGRGNGMFVVAWQLPFNP